MRAIGLRPAFGARVRARAVRFRIVFLSRLYIVCHLPSSTTTTNIVLCCDKWSKESVWYTTNYNDHGEFDNNYEYCIVLRCVLCCDKWSEVGVGKGEKGAL
jgi:hypothetical protein